MPNRSPPDRYNDLARLRPPTFTDAEKPLRRAVAMAYRTAREAMLSHEAALDAPEIVYFQAHPRGSKLPYPLWARQLGDRSDIESVKSDRVTARRCLALPDRFAEIDLPRTGQCTRSGADARTDRCTGERGTNQGTADRAGGRTDPGAAQRTVARAVSACGQGEQAKDHRDL